MALYLAYDKDKGGLQPKPNEDRLCSLLESQSENDKITQAYIDSYIQENVYSGAVFEAVTTFLFVDDTGTSMKVERGSQWWVVDKIFVDNQLSKIDFGISIEPKYMVHRPRIQLNLQELAEYMKYVPVAMERI